MKKYTDEELIEEIKNRLKTNQNTIEECNNLMKQLWLTNKKLEESEAMKSHFISNVTNEIINPFTSIIGLSNSIILSKNDDIERIKNMASLIHSEAFNLDFQLNNIFMAAKLEAGEINLDIFRAKIKDIVKSTIDSFLNEANKKSLSISMIFEGILKTKPNTAFQTDPNKLKIIVANLISNAIKFSNAAGKIEVNCTINNKLLSISIKDYGIGINKKDHEIIFDRFKRLDNSINEQNRGNGLGLSVTKSLLDILKGKIELTSHGKLGTLFLVTIPETVSNNKIDDYSNNYNDFMFNTK
jgi:signal transduction histidine kinase